MQQVDYHIQDHPEPVSWSEDAKAKIKEIIARYPDKQSAIMPILWLAVDEFG